MADILSRLSGRQSPFDTLPSDVQRVLKRAASHGVARFPDGMTLLIPYDWVMVPTGKGEIQVAIGLDRAYRL